MSQLNWDFNYCERKKHGYHGGRYNGRQVFNSAKPSTYLTNYSIKRTKGFPIEGVTWICLAFALLFVALYLGLFDFLY